MDLSNNEEIIRIINNHIDLFEFMGLEDSKFSESEFMFSKEYLKDLKKMWKNNNKKYHPDKYPNASEEIKKELERNFSMNQIIYQILSNYELYNLYLKTVSELQNNHNDLKENFIKTRDEDIKAMIKEATGGKTYDELCIEKDIQYGIDRTLVGKMTGDESNIKISDMINNRNNIYDNIKRNTKKIEFDKNENFSNIFNKNFDNKIDRNITTQEIQTYNDTNSLFNYEKFDYSNIFDNNFSSIDDSFSLISSHIPEGYTSTSSLEDKLNAYNNRTKDYENINKGVKAEKISEI